MKRSLRAAMALSLAALLAACSTTTPLEEKVRPSSRVVTQPEQVAPVRRRLGLVIARFGNWMSRMIRAKILSMTRTIRCRVAASSLTSTASW